MNELLQIGSGKFNRPNLAPYSIRQEFVGFRKLSLEEKKQKHQEFCTKLQDIKRRFEENIEYSDQLAQRLYLEIIPSVLNYPKYLNGTLGPKSNKVARLKSAEHLLNLYLIKFEQQPEIYPTWETAQKLIGQTEEDFIKNYKNWFQENSKFREKIFNNLSIDAIALENNIGFLEKEIKKSSGKKYKKRQPFEKA